MIPRCSENIVIAGRRLTSNCVSIFIEPRRGARGALLTVRRCANLFSSALSTDSELRLSNIKTNNSVADMAALGE
jgi:hypothetical protein